MRKIYLVGSLRNPRIPEIAAILRQDGHAVFDDWFAAGEKADDIWRSYEMARGRSYIEALKAPVAVKNFGFDKDHIDASDTVILILPAGRSGHLELGYAAGCGKRTYILLDAEYERWDLMYRFADCVVDHIDKLRGVIWSDEMVDIIATEADLEQV